MSEEKNRRDFKTKLAETYQTYLNNLKALPPLVDEHQEITQLTTTLGYAVAGILAHKKATVEDCLKVQLFFSSRLENLKHGWQKGNTRARFAVIEQLLFTDIEDTQP
jgi:hypothetical protein